MRLIVVHIFSIALAFVTLGTVTGAPINATTIRFHEGFTHLFGHDNLVRSRDGRKTLLTMNRYSGSGFISSDAYDHGFFSAYIKLPADYSAGVVVAFYTSNQETYPKTHDELDFEFLGNIRGKEWRIQTNVYGNGSLHRGREERYLLPFDPTIEAHQYSILWTPDKIIFYIDDTPIREVVRTEAMGAEYPLKPMSIYATIWDGSTWATYNGKYKVKYKFAPFVAEFTNLALHGCRATAIETLEDADRCAQAYDRVMNSDYSIMTPSKREAMRKYRERYMMYSVCYDVQRYPEGLPECNIIPSEQSRFWEWGENKFLKERRRIRRPSRRPQAVEPEIQGYVVT